MAALVSTLLYSVVLSGFSVRLQDVHHNLLWLFDSAHSNWAMRAYYILSVENYDYYNLDSALDGKGDKFSDLDRSILNLGLIGIGWCVTGYVTMVLCNLQQKR